MDRFKALRRATAAVIVVVGGALVLSCSDGNGLVGGRATYDSPGDIYGYVTGPYGAIYNANVRWVCETHNYTLLGSTSTDEDGYYRINAAAWWTEHEGDTFEGTASKTGYQDDVEHIYVYNPDNDIQVDFYLEPDK